MADKYILYNPYAGGAEANEAVKALQTADEKTIAINICRVSSYRTFFDGLEPDASVVLCGGDGTLNRFVNGIRGVEIKNKIYYLPTGTGNDFARDIGCKPFEESAVCINDYLWRLPNVTVKGEKRLFVNNVGFGIDGYCCETGDKLREENLKKKNPKPINYTKIAIGGLLFHYKPKNATVTVDGESFKFKKVWLATVMNGRYYGGGMMAAPDQERNRQDGKVSAVVFHNVGKLLALLIFPSIFSGKHTKYKKHMTILEGNSVDVEFDRPTPLQIDGETVSDVTGYSVRSDKAGLCGLPERELAAV